jgi:hypothetical protein
MNKHVRYNMHGHMIEYDKKKRTWSWSKWDSAERNGEQKVIRRGGPLQFRKIFSSVVTGDPEYIPARNSEELEKVLVKQGLDFIFLYQGETIVEDRFKTVEEAEDYHNLHACPDWNLTDYWFGFNGELNSWAMYDAFTGALRFAPESIMRQRAQNARIMKTRSNNTTH